MLNEQDKEAIKTANRIEGCQGIVWIKDVMYWKDKFGFWHKLLKKWQNDRPKIWIQMTLF